MELAVVVVVVAVVALLLGFIGGNRLAELNMELRERRVADQRRALNEAAARLRDARRHDQPLDRAEGESRQLAEPR